MFEEEIMRAPFSVKQPEPRRRGGRMGLLREPDTVNFAEAAGWAALIPLCYLE